jgi:serine/alanine adding enzyme
MELNCFESPGREWDEFASQYTDSIFYQSIWSEVLRKGLGGQPLYFYLKEGGNIVAGLPGVLLTFRIFKILYASLPYGNFIGEKAYFLPLMHLLERNFSKKGVDQVRITEAPFLESYQPDSFESLTAKCSLLDLRGASEENIGKSYRNEVKRAIRKAERTGFSVKPATSEKEVKIFYSLYLSSMRRNRAAAKYPLGWFSAVYALLVCQKKADIFFAVRDGEYAAGVVLAYSRVSTHYLHNGSDEVHLGNRPNDLIVDYIIRHSVEEGKAFLDFGASAPEDLSLIRFKEKWGSRSMDIHTYVKNIHPFRCRMWELAKKMAGSNIGSGLVRMIRNQTRG